MGPFIWGDAALIWLFPHLFSVWCCYWIAYVFLLLPDQFKIPQADEVLAREETLWNILMSRATGVAFYASLNVIWDKPVGKELQD
ncbi:MAG: hypothetical protein R3C11_28230 [Planctomycetaceae bacterium]